MARTRRNDDELRAALEHLYYEIKMLQGTMALLATDATGDSFLTNVLIESFTIHARALMHFLYPSGPIQDTDVLAEDFFDDAGHWGKIRPDEPAVFGKARGRVNKEIAHLTYDRQLVTPELKAWNFVALGKELLEIVHIFLNAVPQRLGALPWQQVVPMCGSDTTMVPSQVAGEYKTDVSTRGNI